MEWIGLRMLGSSAVECEKSLETNWIGMAIKMGIYNHGADMTRVLHFITEWSPESILGELGSNFALFTRLCRIYRVTWLHLPESLSK